MEQLQATAQATVEITGTVESSAENARLATDLARENAELAIKGGEVIGALVQTMDEIRASSGQIGDIIGVIDGIAFQTNIEGGPFMSAAPLRYKTELIKGVQPGSGVATMTELAGISVGH